MRGTSGDAGGPQPQGQAGGAARGQLPRLSEQLLTRLDQIERTLWLVGLPALGVTFVSHARNSFDAALNRTTGPPRRAPTFAHGRGHPGEVGNLAPGDRYWFLHRAGFG